MKDHLKTQGNSDASWLRIGIGALVLVASAGGAWWASSGGGAAVGPGGRPGHAVERLAPGFSLPDPSGKTHALSEWKGNVVVLHFWAAWCAPCLDELPRWAALAPRYKGRKVQFVAISLDEKWEEALKVLPEKDRPENLASLIDPASKTPEEYGTFQFPETYLIGASGGILAKWVGPQDWSSPEISGAVDVALKFADSGK